ncbi:hypothetical protein [Mycolicibacterium goodii]|uniref:PE-PGRS family protein n=1 Tax=Mycolicibacterium goodii TaxID=134601 RepID=A0ABS6HL80_MYCGD|nr:hypothetical protein [Mycolicibacterium goodii]MBU8812581.1 hypothetical protein [Mycolicibacterium goodii]MBU8823453.1 hypothetical protein [Mycolicibacterium goodii]MBU8835498.1 hypothetical protein [Mycolicibacterium goodii]ULN46435.1 hypothetical protein MI170_24545 [Mycolicibacterium goodii]
MQQAVRSYLAAGVAFAGAGVIAISPVAPVPPDITERAQSSAGVALSALANPIDGYAAAFTAALKNAEALTARIAADPAPILSNIVRNQVNSVAGIATFAEVFGAGVINALAETPEQLQSAVDKFTAGDVSGALETVLQTVLGPVVNGVVDTLLFNPEVWTGLQNAIRQPIANALSVIDLLAVPDVYNVLGPVLAPVQLLTDVTAAFGEAGDDVFAGFKSGDLEKVANAVINLGPNVTYALLNGDPDFVGFGAGLLGDQGVIAGLLTLRDLVAEAIAPATTAKTTAVAEPAALTKVASVTLDVPKAIEAPAGTDAETTAPAPSAEPAAGVPADAGTPAKPVASADEATTDATATDGTATDGTATDGAETPDAKDAKADGKTVVEDGPKTVPAKSSTTAKPKKVNPIKEVRNGIRGAIKNVRNGVKDAVAGLSGKAAKPAKQDASGKSGGSDSDGGGSGGGAE